MMFHTPEMIERSRLVYASSLLAGRADLRGYPYRHLAVISQPDVASAMAVTEVMASVEMMQQWGWELVNVAALPTSERTSQLCAVLRRRG